jgi:hypothetical protein
MKDKKTKTNSTKGEKTIKRYAKKSEKGRGNFFLTEDNKKERTEDQGSNT